MINRPPTTHPNHLRRLVRIDTVIRLRWLAALGQLAAIFVVSQGLEFDVPVIPCLVIIGFASAVNFTLQIAYKPVQRIGPAFAAFLLILNIAELAGLLYLTGGLQNPFAFLFLGPVLISATALPPRLTLATAAFAMICATLLGFFHWPLPWYSEAPLAIPFVYTIGVWLSLFLAVGVTSIYSFQVTEQARKLADALAATELVLEREQHLAQLDGLAAAAAHELGTPLSTIAVVARELERISDPQSAIGADVRIVREQAQRCREILGKLTQLSSAGDIYDRIALSAMIEEIAAPHRDFGIAIETAPATGIGPEPVGTRNAATLHALGNIVENAVDFARAHVSIEAAWTTEWVEIVIADDGPGFAPEILGRIGEPYVSRRRSTSGERTQRGLGLGLFIAKTLLERSSASVTFANKTFPAHGAVVTVRWPRADFESRQSGLEATA